MKLLTDREHGFSRRLLPVLLAGLLLSGCGASPDEMIGSARGFIAEGDYPAAVIQLKNVLQEDSNNAEARFLLGKVYFERGEMANSAKELGFAHRLGYDHEVVTPMFARALVEHGEGDKVLAQFSEAKLADSKGQSQVLAAVGDALFSKDLNQAYKKYRSALELDPENKLIPAAREIGVYVFVGDALARDLYSRINLKDAKHLITLTGNNGLNVDLGIKARNHMREHGRQS